MDANGIGTDATMADHIEKILERQYVFKQARGRDAQYNNEDEIAENDDGIPDEVQRGGRGPRGRGERHRGQVRGTGRGQRGGVMEFVPTNLGIGLVEGYNSMNFDVSLIKPYLRKQVVPFDN